MQVLSRAYRRAQLWGVRALDREMLVDLYRRAVGLRPSQNLPLNTTYAQMIEAILDHEQEVFVTAKMTRAIDA